MLGFWAKLQKKEFDSWCLYQPERLRDEEIDHLEQLLQSQALRPAPQLTTNTQEESPLPINCFKFQNRVFGKTNKITSCFLSCGSGTDVVLLFWGKINRLQ